VGQTTGIAWTDSTWSPLRARIRPDALEIAEQKGYTSLVQVLTARKPNGDLRSPAGKVGPHCEHVSPGCENCYSEFNGKRCLPANGTGLPFDRRSRDLVEIFLDEKILMQPLHWRRPRRIFVNSQTDTWLESVPYELIDRMFGVAALCPQHSFQFLTKRAARMFLYMTALRQEGWTQGYIAEQYGRPGRFFPTEHALPLNQSERMRWPLQNVWLGISAEDQQRWDERSKWLRKTPAAVRFVSYEPALGPIDFGDLSGIHQIITGGESGRGARPSQLAWYRSTITQCRAASIACFVKQFGKRPLARCLQYACESDPGHGANPMDWPREYRIQEFPA